MAGDENDWFETRPAGAQNIYDLEARRPVLRRSLQRKFEGRNRNRTTRQNDTERANRMYAAITHHQGIEGEGGYTAMNAYYQNMGEMNYPADEQFRKESQITKNRLERDKNMKMKKKQATLIRIPDLSTDEFVIPCSFPSVMNYIDKKEEKRDLPPSSSKIEEFLKIPRPLDRWADANDGGESEDVVPRRDEAIERFMISNAVRAASLLQKCDYSICLSFEDYPPAFEERKEIMRTIVIDGCAVMKQVNFNYEVPWNNTGGANNTFRGNKLLVTKPLIELAMRFILQGHKTVIILPAYYMIPIFAGVRQKVDNLDSFDALVQTGIVEFIEEDSIEEMHKKLFIENEKHEGTWVSTSDLERIIIAYKREQKQRQTGERSGMDDRSEESSIAEFSHRITPFFYDNKIVLPLHMSTKEKQIMYCNKLLYHEENEAKRVAERRNNQMTMEEQRKILFKLQDLFDLPLRLLRGMMMYRRILKEIDDEKEVTKKIADETAIRDLVDETRRAFGMDVVDCDPDVTHN